MLKQSSWMTTAVDSNVRPSRRMLAAVLKRLTMILDIRES